MYVAPHQQAIAPWAAPVAAAAAAPPGLAQQFQPTPNGGGGRSSPPPGVITRRPKIDKMTGRTGEEILVCWLTPAPPNPFGHKFQKEWRVVSDPSRAQEVSWEARAQAQKYRDEFGKNVSSAAVGASRPQQQPRRIPHPGRKPNVDGSGLSTKDKKKFIEDWQKNVEEYTKQELRDARATESSDRNNTNQRSQSQNPMSGFQGAYLQQQQQPQLLQQHKPPVAGPAHPAQPLTQSFPARVTNIGDQLAAQLSQVQPIPVAGGYVIPEAVVAALARGQIPPGVPQPQQQQQQHQARQGQSGSRFTPQGRFEPLIVIPDLNAPAEFPRLPRVLGEMKVRHEEWSAFIQEILGTWQDRNPVPGRYGTAARRVSEIVDKWNEEVFMPLGVDVAFFCGDKRKSGDPRTQYNTRNDQLSFLDTAAPLDDDDNSPDDDDDDDDGGASVRGLRSQITPNLRGIIPSPQYVQRPGVMRREPQRVLGEKGLAKISIRQYEPAHSIAVFPVIPAEHSPLLTIDESNMETDTHNLSAVGALLIRTRTVARTVLRGGLDLVIRTLTVE